MRYHWSFILCCLFWVISPQRSIAQYKYEKEFRLKEQAVPRKALAFFPEDLDMKKLKWYAEENLEGNSIEAKFILDKKRYSVEFDTLGKLQDIEIQFKKNELPASILTSIEQLLSVTFDRFKWKRIQLQYVGNDLLWNQIWPSLKKQADIVINYEIVVQTKKGKAFKLYECLFNENGELIRQSEIIFRNTDNLEY